jgi:hypothetical protein
VQLESWKNAFDLVVGLASIIGLYFSIRARQEARLAKEAARAAKNEIRKSNAEQELRALNERAKALLQAAQKDELIAARLLCIELHGTMIQSSHRWKEFLGDAGASKINEGARKIKEISISLSTRKTTLTVDERDRTVAFCHDIIALLAEESGKLLLKLEGDVGND